MLRSAPGAGTGGLTWLPAKGLEAWRTRSLADLDVIYVYLDAFALRVRSAGKVVSAPVLGVVAVPSDGQKHLLALELCGGESPRGKAASIISSRAGCWRRCWPSSTATSGCGALVLEYLARRGVTEIIAVHDGWFVPASVEVDPYDDDGLPLSGAQVLAHAITYVGAEWLSGVGRIPDPDKPLWYFTAVPPDETRPGLAVVYDWFADSLKGSPYHDFAFQIRSRWGERVAAGRWPRFTAS